MTEEFKAYLGDGIYASFDGHAIRLETQRFRQDGKSDEIFLELSEYKALVSFAEKCWLNTLKQKLITNDPDWLGHELAQAYRHIEWLVTRGMGDSSDSFGIRLNAKQFVSRHRIGLVLTRWPTEEPKL